MANNLRNQSQFSGENESAPEFSEKQNMTSQRKSRFNKPFVISLFLVIFILGVYTLHYRPNSSISEADKQHANWLKQMKRESSVQNDSVNYKHSDTNEATQSGIESALDKSQVSMVLPANIPEDLHRAQTPGIQYEMEKSRATLNNNIQDSNKLIEMKLGDSNTQEKLYKQNDYAELADNDDGDDDNDDVNDYVNNSVGNDNHHESGSVIKEQFHRKELTTVSESGVHINELEQNQEAINNNTKINTSDNITQQYKRDTTVPSQTLKMQLEPENYAKPWVPADNKPTTSSRYIENNVPSYNAGLNNNPVIGQQYLDVNKDINSVLTDTNAQFPNNAQGDTGIERNKAFQSEGGTTVSPFTLQGLIESRMKLHKALKDMNNIFGDGSATYGAENNNGWNSDQNKNHVYSVNDKQNMFANLVMHVNRQAEPVTGTKPMRPLYKSRLEYSRYLQPINWKTSFEDIKTPTFECVPVKTLYSFIRICIHPPAVKSDVSSSLKSEASWEYNALRDVQKALLEYKDSMLIDIGASIGVFSLAAAALNRNVIAIEPYPSHIQVFKQSVALNNFSEHITLFQVVVSDRQGKVLIKALGDHVNNVYIQTVEDDEQPTNYTLIVNSVTLDDIEKVCPCRIAVLKIDIPGFVDKALQYSHFFFKYLYVTHVFMHWDTSESGLCLFIARFFTERGYKPYGDLNGSNQLNLQYAGTWTNDIVIWKL